jgi:(S)-2-hydroxy-acid oxidase
MTALPQPINLFEFEQFAKERLPKEEYDYIAGGATDEISVDRNHRAFASWALRPRVLRDVSSVDLSTTVLGTKVSLPVLIAPCGGHKRAHPRRRARHLSRRSGVRQYHGRQRQFEYVF